MILFNLNKKAFKLSQILEPRDLQRLKSSLGNIFFKIPRRNLYYDNGKANNLGKNENMNFTNSLYTRNLDFVFNLGYNNISELVESNIPLLKMFSLTKDKKLIEKINEHYIDLLEALELGDISVLDEVLEKNLKFVLFNDIVKYSRKNFTFKIINKSSPIEIRFLAFNELYNIEIEREKNFISEDYVMAPFKKNKFILANENTYKPKDNKTILEIEDERKAFEKSDFKTISYNHFVNGLNEQFKVEYCKLKLKPNASDDDLQYFVSLMNSLEKTESKTDQYSMHLKNEFADYYILRDKFIKEKKEKVDLYLHFKENMPNQYKHFFENNANKSFFRNKIKTLKNNWFNKIITQRRQVFGKKSIQVIDVEITSKFRLEILDSDGKNVLNTKFNYYDIFKSASNEKAKNDCDNSSDPFKDLDYDKNYIFEIPEWKWNFNNDSYVQKHVLRIEFEKLNKRLFTSRNLYKTMKITDIDLALNGNRHVKWINENNNS